MLPIIYVLYIGLLGTNSLFYSTFRVFDQLQLKNYTKIRSSKSGKAPILSSANLTVLMLFNIKHKEMFFYGI